MGDLTNVLGGSFNPADVPPSEYEPIPQGDYPAVVTEVELKETRNGGTGIMFKFSVLGTTHDGRVISSFINVVNSSEKAQTIGRQQLAEICNACGLANASDTSDFINKRLKIRVGVEKGQGTYIDKYGEEKPQTDKNVIKRYLSLNQVSTEAKATEPPFGGDDVPATESQEKSRPWA